MKKSLSRFLTLVVLSLLAVACGGGSSNVLNGIKVETTQTNNETWMSFAANINLGAMSFASISVPVLHPRGQTQIGQLELISGLAGQNQLKLSINLSEVSDIDLSQGLLPNGNMLPMIANNPTIAINIGNGAKVYLTLSQNVTALAVAVPISAFDQIGQSLPGLNFFPIVTQGDITGTAGIFTGKNAGQNGIAVVADLSKVVNLGKLMPSSQALVAQAQEARDDEPKLVYRSHSGSASQKAQLDMLLYKLHQKKTVLRMKK